MKWMQPVSYTHLDVYKRQDFIQNKKMVSAGVKLNGTDLQACLSFDNSNGEPVIEMCIRDSE